MGTSLSAILPRANKRYRRAKAESSHRKDSLLISARAKVLGVFEAFGIGGEYSQRSVVGTGY